MTKVRGKLERPYHIPAYHSPASMSAGINSDMFEQLIGKEALDLILNAVRCDSINRQKMLDISGDFGREVRGRHTKRMARQGTINDDAEMMNIFSDWWELGDTKIGPICVDLKSEEETFNMRRSVLTRLVTLLESSRISQKPLARDIRKVFNALNDTVGKFY